MKVYFGMDDHAAADDAIIVVRLLRESERSHEKPMKGSWSSK